MSGLRNVWTLDTVRNRCTEEGECWLWDQSLNSCGYPQACIDGKNTRVQRYIFAVLLGRRLQSRWVVTAKCRNKRCCAPDCLEAITRGELLKRAYASGARNTDTEYQRRQQQAIKQGWARKLDADKAREIRARVDEGINVLAAEYGVHRKTIVGVRSGRYWRETLRGASVFAP